MITTELVIARHAEATCNLAGLVGGPATCTGLTDRGHRQTQLLAQRLKEEHLTTPFAVCYTTPRQRVQETAAPVAATLGLDAVVDDELRGADHGAADGRPWRQVKTAFGGPPQHDPDRPYAQGSESWRQYLNRAGAALTAILNCHAGHKILIVAHGETIEAAHALLLELPPRFPRAVGFVTGHTSLTRWHHQLNRFNQARWLLAAHNDTRHLDHS